MMEQRSRQQPIDMTEALAPHQVKEIQESYRDKDRPILMIGPMAAGKSYIGSHLARLYGYEFLDSDQLIVDQYGDVTQIFSDLGEGAFRQIEAQVIEDILASPTRRNLIFSLGGGAPMTDRVARALAEETVIYIRVDASTVAPRILNSKTRPLLQEDPLGRWQQIFDQRRARYESLATYTLDARGGRDIADMAAELQDFILNQRKGQA